VQQLAAVLESHGHGNMVLSSREYSHLADMVEILDPLLEATQLTEGEITVTISFALPSVLSLIMQLQDMVDKQQLKFCSALCKGLLKSLRTRFSGMLRRMEVDAQPNVDVNSLPYGSDIYGSLQHILTLALSSSEWNPV